MKTVSAEMVVSCVYDKHPIISNTCMGTFYTCLTVGPICGQSFNGSTIVNCDSRGIPD